MYILIAWKRGTLGRKPQIIAYSDTYHRDVGVLPFFVVNPYTTPWYDWNIADTA